MAFNESFVTKETNDKQEAIAEALEGFQQEEKDLYSDVENREEASESNTKKLYYEQLLEQTNPTIAELIKNNNIEIDYDDKEITFDININHYVGGGNSESRNYNITIAKDGVKISGELAIPGLGNDEEYNKGNLQTIIENITNKILKEEGDSISDDIKEKITKKLEAAKKVFTTLFQ